MLIELFSLGVTAKSLRAKRNRKLAISLRRGHFDLIFQVEGFAPTNHFFLRKLGWCFVWNKNLDRSFFYFVTNHAFDGRTDGQNSHRWTASAFHAAR